MPKYSQIKPIVSSLLNTAYLAATQAGSVVLITFQNLLSNYYNKDQIDAIVANITVGAAPFTIVEKGPYSIAENGTLEVTHNLHNESAIYKTFEWSDSMGKYLLRQTDLAEGNRTADTVTFVSGRAIDKLMFVFIG
ncbi:MAG: hypothetical protein RQ866_05025 [Bacteroidales bacterium]|nr:hypothetical protein [Bacteroidales bacterium]